MTGICPTKPELEALLAAVPLLAVWAGCRQSCVTGPLCLLPCPCPGAVLWGVFLVVLSLRWCRMDRPSPAAGVSLCLSEPLSSRIRGSSGSQGLALCFAPTLMVLPQPADHAPVPCPRYCASSVPIRLFCCLSAVLNSSSTFKMQLSHSVKLFPPSVPLCSTCVSLAFVISSRTRLSSLQAGLGLV